ncbi:MAG TPA: MBL fold metallo-hydrolase [Kofleriaceae bacterium]|jgi:glyoxylase-like metal-dependent hydrolase (beta-lactamase superfamily II)
MDKASSTSATTVEALYEQVRNAVGTSEPAYEPEISQITPGIRVLALRTPTLPPAAHTNTYLVGPVGAKQIVVDPGSPYPDQQAVLDRVLADSPPELILLTHHHGDHVGGAQVLADRWGVPIAAHANTQRRLAGRVKIDRVLVDGERVGDIECVFTPGHADGHLCFALHDFTIAGDMVAGIGTILIDPSEGDMALYLDSLRTLLARPNTALLPAHGPVISDGAAKLREYIAHRTMREDRVVAAVAGQADASAAELVAIAYADTPRVLWGLAERSLLAHIDKLVREGRVREVSPGRWSSR